MNISAYFTQLFSYLNAGDFLIDVTAGKPAKQFTRSEMERTGYWDSDAVTKAVTKAERQS